MPPTSFHKAATCIDSTLPKESGDTDVQSSGTITALLPPADLPKVTNQLKTCKGLEMRTARGKRFQGRAAERPVPQFHLKKPEPISEQTQEENVADPPGSLEDILYWKMISEEETKCIRVIDEETEKVVDNLPGDESGYSQGLTDKDFCESKAELITRAIEKGERERTMNMARDGAGLGKGRDGSNNQLKGNQNAGEYEFWFPNHAGRKQEQQRRPVDQRGELAGEGGTGVQVEAAFNLNGGSWFPNHAARNWEQQNTPVDQRGGLAWEERCGSQGGAKSNLNGGSRFPNLAGRKRKQEEQKNPMDKGEELPKEGEAREQVEAMSNLAKGSMFPGLAGPSHVVPQAQQGFQGMKFGHDRRSVGRTKNNQRPFYNPDMAPDTVIDTTWTWKKPEV